MLRDFKQAMIQKFEITNIGMMTYYLGIEIKQGEDKIFMNQNKFVKKILNKYKIKDCVKVNIVECGVNMLKNDGEKINSIIFKSLVWDTWHAPVQIFFLE